MRLLVPVFIAAFALWRITRRESVAADEKVDFTDALVATQTYAPYEMPETAEGDDK